MVAWISGYEVNSHGLVNRFARWGLLHGPFWGLAAGLIALPLSGLIAVEVHPLSAIGVGLLAGIVGGPILGTLVGLVCVLADRVPKWFLDAPDYVAVLTVAAALAAVVWPVLQLGRASPVVAVVAFILLIAVPVIDAAQNAPELLHPRRH